MNKVTLLGANLDTGNMGVGALMMGAITCVKHAWADAEISLMDYDDQPKTFHCRINGDIVSVKLIPMRFSKAIFLPNNIALLLALSIIVRWLPFRYLKKRVVSGNACLKHLQDTGIVLSIAGGDSFSDIYGMGRFIYIVLPQLLAIAAGNKLVLMPQTIGPFKNIFASCIAAFIMKRSSLVYARDDESLSVAKRLIGESNSVKARFCYDMGFVLDPIKPATSAPEAMNLEKRNKLLVGLNISGLLCIGGYNRKNMFELKVDYTDLVRSLIDYLIDDKKAIVALVPHVFGASPESDVSAATRFFDELTGRFGADLILIRGDYDQNGIKYIIGQCDFFIGSRMHACIAALSQSVPAVGIAYSRKFAGVMRSIGVEGLIADPRKNSTLEILKSIGTAIDTKDKWGYHLNNRMPQIKNAVLDLLVEKQATSNPRYS